MRMLAPLSSFLVFIGTLTTLGAQRLPLSKTQPEFAVVAANVVNVRDGRVLSDTTIFVQDGRIESVGRTAPSQAFLSST